MTPFEFKEKLEKLTKDKWKLIVDVNAFSLFVDREKCKKVLDIYNSGYARLYIRSPQGIFEQAIPLSIDEMKLIVEYFESLGGN